MQVVLVRPWTDAHAGGGCCSGDASHGVCFEGRVDGAPAHDRSADLVAETYRRLRRELPDADVQVVAANNTAYLLPHAFRAVRRRAGTRRALREALRATTAGAVLVDGERLGLLDELGVDGVLAAVRRRTAAPA